MVWRPDEPTDLERSVSPSLAAGVRLHRAAVERTRAGDYAAAVALAAQAAAVFEAGGDEARLELVRTLRVRGGGEEMLSRYEAAAATFSRALEACGGLQRSSDEERAAHVCALCDLARIHQIRGHYHASEPLYLKARAVSAELPVDHGARGTVLCGIGMLYKYMARFEEAERAYAQAFSIWEAACGEESPEIGDLHHNIAGLEHARGRPEAGEPHARLSVDLHTRAFGENHPVVAQDLAALAAILDECGAQSEAEELYRRVLSIFEAAFGPEHYDVAVNLGNLGALLHSRGCPEEAEALYRRALAVEEKLLGPVSPDLGMTANNLAAALSAQKRYDDAMAWYTRALATFEATLPPDHPHVTACRENLERLHAKIRPV